MNAPPGLVTLALAGLWLAACGGGERGADDRPRSANASASGCAQPPGDSAHFVATKEYIKGLTPKPRRFLSAVGTDSALPDAAFRAIQDAGPSYLYSRDPAGQKAVLKRLEEVGPWTALLVTWHGVERVGDTTAYIRLRGRYLIDESGGKAVAPARRMRFDCEAGNWRFTRTEEERAS